MGCEGGETPVFCVCIASEIYQPRVGS
jgi:hypothetical protein